MKDKMALAVGLAIGGAILNATTFVGGSYLAKYLAGDSGAMKEKIRHDKALEAYQREMGEWEKKRSKYMDYLDAKYVNKKIAEKNLRETDNALFLYAKTHPDPAYFDKEHPEPKFSDYYEPSKKQKQYEMFYVGGGMLALTYVITKVT